LASGHSMGWWLNVFLISSLVMSGTGTEKEFIEKYANDQCQKEVLRDLVDRQRQHHVLMFSTPATVHAFSLELRASRTLHKELGVLHNPLPSGYVSSMSDDLQVVKPSTARILIIVML
jgi:hypothetical protein